MTKAAGSDQVKVAVMESALPVVRFVGHALAVAIGLVLLTPVLMIPVGVVAVLAWLGFKELGGAIQNLEHGLLYCELAFFAVTLAIGAMELLATEALRAAKQIKAHWIAFRA